MTCLTKMSRAVTSTALLLVALISIQSAATPCIYFDPSKTALTSGEISRKIEAASKKFSAGKLTEGRAEATKALNSATALTEKLEGIESLPGVAGDKKFVLAKTQSLLSQKLARTMLKGRATPVQVTSFVREWKQYLTAVYDMYQSVDPGYANHFATTGKVFTDIYRYADLAQLQSFIDQINRVNYRSASSLIVDDFLYAAIEARIKILEGRPFNTAYSRGVIYINSRPLRSIAYENPKSVKDVAKNVRQGRVGYSWGKIESRGRSGSAIKIQNAGGYVNWLNQEHFSGNLHPYLQEAIKQYVQYMSISLPDDFSSLDGLVPIRNVVPGTHAEIFVYNDLFLKLNRYHPEYFSADRKSFKNLAYENQAFSKMGISTFGELGHAFRACFNCSGIINPKLPVLSGYRWSYNVM